jgi:16S rRNA (uracil1498-N3)-methyltransferase
MDRVFLPARELAAERVVIRSASHRHLFDVLRVRHGERFAATDGEGGEVLLEAERAGRREIVARVIERNWREPGPGRAVTLAIAPPKGPRMDTAIEKSVECGVGRVIPLQTERTIVKVRSPSQRLERWQRVAVAAAVQAGRVWIPEVTAPRNLGDVMKETSSAHLLLAHPQAGAVSVRAALAESTPDDSVVILIGPEGGFAPAEVEEGRRLGAVAVSLGPNRLRTETAAIVGVSLVIAALTDRL